MKKMSLHSRLNAWRKILGQKPYPEGISLHASYWTVHYNENIFLKIFSFQFKVWSTRKFIRFKTCEYALDFLDEMPSNCDAVFIVSTPRLDL